MDGGRVRQVKVLCDGKPVLYGEVVERWQSDGVFRAFFFGILADAPYGMGSRESSRAIKNIPSANWWALPKIA
jgi:hypothetical protein